MPSKANFQCWCQARMSIVTLVVVVMPRDWLSISPMPIVVLTVNPDFLYILYAYTFLCPMHTRQKPSSLHLYTAVSMACSYCRILDSKQHRSLMVPV